MEQVMFGCHVPGLVPQLTVESFTTKLFLGSHRTCLLPKHLIDVGHCCPLQVLWFFGASWFVSWVLVALSRPTFVMKLLSFFHWYPMCPPPPPLWVPPSTEECSCWFLVFCQMLPWLFALLLPRHWSSKAWWTKSPFPPCILIHCD